ncbi:MAG: hypothetical protein AAGG75_18575 [Bacteroidota bacterium]
MKILIPSTLLLLLGCFGLSTTLTAQVAPPSYFQIYMEVVLEQDSLDDKAPPIERLATRVEMSVEDPQAVERMYLKVMNEEDQVLLDRNFNYKTLETSEDIRVERYDKMLVLVFGHYDHPTFFKGEVYLENKEGQRSELKTYIPVKAD